MNSSCQTSLYPAGTPGDTEVDDALLVLMDELDIDEDDNEDDEVDIDDVLEAEPISFQRAGTFGGSQPVMAVWD